MMFDIVKIIRMMGFEAPMFSRYYSSYQGIVTDNKDPEKRGRIKVRVPSLFAKNQSLAQWCLPNSRAGKDKGIFFPPEIGDTVWVKFEFGDIDYPKYEGGFWAKGELPADFSSDYPNVKGIILKSGQKIIFSETAGKQKTTISHPSGAKIVIDDTSGSESVLVQTSKGQKIEMKGTGEVSVTATKVNIVAGEISLGSSASFSAVLYERLKSIFDVHIHPTGVGPSGPPLAPNTLAAAEASSSRTAKSSTIKIKG